jgi:rod shape determining protein RodA
MSLRIERGMVAKVPWGVMFSTFAICALGIWNLASAARPPAAAVWSAQSIYVLLGISTVTAIALVDYRLIQRMAVPVYVLNIVALIALRFFGHKAKGAESWFIVGPVRVQPAEFMKIGIILMLAKFYHEDQAHQGPYSLLRLWKPTLIVLVPFVLVLVQPDLGTALMIFLSSFTVILFGRVQRWILLLLAFCFLVASVVLWNDYVRPEPKSMIFRQHLKKHQDKRISSWLDPESDLRGANYHSAQSRIAVGSGGLFGKGWREGTQTGLRFLPEQHTDFIFSVWAEEHGFFMCLLLLALYAALLLTSLGVAFTARERFGAFVCVGVAAMLFWQIFENIGMVTGLLPVTGITLPLLSYGGSSLMSVMISLGLIVNIGMRRHMF